MLAGPHIVPFLSNKCRRILVTVAPYTLVSGRLAPSMSIAVLGRVSLSC